MAVRVCMLKAGGKLIGFEAEGHAGFAENGLDIVCSAVSALTQTALIGLKEKLRLPVGCEVREGYLFCVLGNGLRSGQYDQAELLLDTMRMGLLSIRSQYGDYLKITEREV